MELPRPPESMQVRQDMEGIVVEMVTYRPSRLGQALAAAVLLGSLGLLVLALPAGAVLGGIVAVLLYLLAGTLTGPTLTIQITPRVLTETIEGRIRTWPLEELRDVEEERWSAMERRLGQVRFSTEEGGHVIGGGNRWEEIRWLGGALRRAVRLRREQLEASDPEARMAVRPPAAIMEMRKR